MLISVSIFIRGRSPTSQARKVASRLSKRARILSAAIFLSTGHQSGVLNAIEDGPDIPMLDDYGVTEPLGIFGEVFFDPGMGGLGERKQQEERTAILAAEVGSDRVGEFAEAAKESCEDITPPVAKDALESWIWEKAKVSFAPYRPYPFFRRLAPWRFVWLGCWSANRTLTLDTWKEYRSSKLFQMVRKYLEIDLPRLAHIELRWDLCRRLRNSDSCS